MLPSFAPVKRICYLSFLISTAIAQGQIAQYLDFYCTEKSLVNPNISLDLYTCLITSGAQGVVIQLLPACLMGNATNATLQVYKDQSCAVLDSAYHNDDNCLATRIGVPSVMFICGSVAGGNSHTTSTTTVTAVSVLVPMAKATGPSTPTTLAAFSSRTTTDSNTLATSVTPASSAPNPSQSDASSNIDNSTSGLSLHEQILIGIGIPVAAILVTLLTWLCPRPWGWRMDEGPQNTYQLLHYPVVRHMPHWHQ